MNISKDYQMSFSTGGLFINESISLAKIHILGDDWRNTVAQALDLNFIQQPKAASRQRTLREIANRLSMLALDELELLINEVDRSEIQAVLWTATCRTYRFVREFAIEVVQERFLALRLDLSLQTFDSFFESRIALDERLAAVSSGTRAKLRQVFFRIMREAGIITADNQIQQIIVSRRVVHLLERNDRNALRIFPGMKPTDI